METYKLDEKDKKIISELEENARKTNNQIGKKVKLTKESVKYRIDKLLREKVIFRFHTIINYFKLGITKYKVYFKLTNANETKINEIAEYLTRKKNTEWVATTTGEWDLIVGFLVKSPSELNKTLQEIYSRYKNQIKEKAITNTIYLAHETRDISEKSKNKKIIYHTSEDKQEEIDSTDDNILRILTNNARINITEIAERLKTTPRIIQYRIKKLEDKKIILGYRAHLNPRKIGNIFCKLIIYLSNLEEEKVNEFINFCSNLKGAVWPQRVIGSWDFELDMELENYEEFQKTIIKIKERFPEIISKHNFCILSKDYKLDLYPNAEKELN